MNKHNDVTVYVCGERGAGHYALARLIQVSLAKQGMQVGDLDDIDWDCARFKRDLRMLLDVFTTVDVRIANFTSDRINELLNRDSECNGIPIMLSRISWGKNALSPKIFPSHQYMVKMHSSWHTGTFRMSQDCKNWEFVHVMPEIDPAKLKRFALQKEGMGLITEIYEIVDEKDNQPEISQKVYST